MFDKEKAKEEIKFLIGKYNLLVKSGKLKSYNEEMTKKDFILPLFRALGWSVEDGEEVTAEEKVSRGRVDYAFRIDGIPKLFLEAKALKIDLDKVEFAEQAINYAWHKGATWAILTDFEGIKVFNAEWKTKNPLQNMFFSLDHHQFLERFDQLLLLSRESLEQGLLSKEAEKWGKKAKKIPVDKQLLSDLTNFRELLTKNILKLNHSKDLSEEELEEAVQRILDRLIFIRTLEDKKLEAPVLQYLIRADTHKKVYKKLNILFREIDEIYNSKLFTEHLCEELVIDDDVLERIIKGLFKTADNTVHYDFGAIDADVLGNIYEQYLGHILKKTAKRAKLTSGKAKRKEQGIYYTPTYVVDYIVKNTVGELAKNKRFDLENIKILDPACGSGSFLMKAFDYLVTLSKQKNGNIDQTKLDLTGVSVTYGKKVEILKDNIFGVDLDPKAVEIAQLNLLLKAAEKKQRLPTLRENIKVGNSLIYDPVVAGKRAFKWSEEFEAIMKGGGFDVVVGNPPYVRPENVLKKDRIYFLNKENYNKTFGRFDLYVVFIEKALNLLSEGGYFSFIIPFSFLNQNYSKKLREWILNDFTLTKVIDLSNIKVFEQAAVNTCILIIKKEKSSKNHFVSIIKPNTIGELIHNNTGEKIKQSLFKKMPLNMIRTDLTTDKIKLIEKIKEQSMNLADVCYCVIGSVPHNSKTGASKDRLIKSIKTSASEKPYIEGKDMKRYFISGRNIFLDYQPKLMHRPKFPELFENEKLIVRNISTKEGLMGIYDNHHYYTNDTVSLCVPWKSLQGLPYKSIKAGEKEVNLSNRYNLKYLLAFVNSKLVNFYFKTILSANLHVYPEAIRNLPIKQIDFSNSRQKEVFNKLINLVEKIQQLKLRLLELKEKTTDEKARVEKETEKLDSQIDQEVYKLYGLKNKEIKLIEESLQT
jgi:type I restriction-modification system DNA methylase subunit